MPAFSITFHRHAASEYRAARDWYAERSTEVAKRFCEGLDHAVDRIATHADSLPFFVGQYRYVRVGRFPYLLVFRPIDAHAVMIFAVAHTSRRPGYWRRRK